MYKVEKILLYILCGYLKMIYIIKLITHNNIDFVQKTHCMTRKLCNTKFYLFSKTDFIVTGYSSQNKLMDTELLEDEKVFLKVIQIYMLYIVIVNV